jgi:membrane fusion protein, heavy metal efflux system
MNMSRWWLAGGALLAVIVAGLWMFSGSAVDTPANGHGAESQEFERGPHRGRMLRSGDFALEMTIFETGVPPEFHVYAYNAGKPVAPSEVKLTVVLTRLGGRTDRFTFAPREDYLVGSGEVTEPHSFDVAITATHSGKTHKWSYASYEGRTVIGQKAAEEAGVATEKAGPATIEKTVELLGTAELAPGAKADLRARFPGRVLSVAKHVGEKVTSGEVLARVESNESLQAYAIVSPVAGVVLSRAINPGDVTGEGVVFSVGNPAKLAAVFHIFDRDAALVKAGQKVHLSSLDGSMRAEAAISSLSPVRDPATQTVTARVMFDNADGRFVAGAPVRGSVVVEEVQVPLAVRSAGIQPFRDFEVVFAKVGDTYEVRMLEIGRRTAVWTEVLGGIAPGEEYVAQNSFLIRADIEKSGASHDH